MDNESDDNGVSRSQHSDNADGEPTGSNANLKNKNPPVEGNEENNLKDALEDGDIDLRVIDKILDNNPSLVNRPWITPLKETPLHFATRRGEGDVVLHLLKRSDIQESVNKADCDGFLPLHRALDNEEWFNKEICMDLISRMSPDSLSSKTKENDTALHFAARAQQLDVVQRLCTELPQSVIDSKNKAGCAAIHEGIRSWEVVQCLLRHNASRVVNDRGDTLLHAVVASTLLGSSQGFETLEALMKDGVNLGTQDNDKNTPFHVVANNLDGPGMATTVLEKLLGLSHAQHHEQTQSSLSDALKKKNYNGDTVLHIIASKKHDDVRSGLPTRTKSWKQMQVEEAVECIVSVCPELLLTNDEDGNSPLHRACLDGNRVTAEVLLQADQELGPAAHHIANCRNRSKDMPLHLVVCRIDKTRNFESRGTYESILELLLFYGADSQKTDGNNLEAAEVARRKSLIEVADFICQYRPRNIRLKLEPIDEDTAKVDDYFLALSWPKWDKAVRQQPGEPSRMWPHMAPVHQMIFKARDYPCRQVNHYVKPNTESRQTPYTPGLDLAPIHQAQIRLASCRSKGWTMVEGRDRREMQEIRRMHENHSKSEREKGLEALQGKWIRSGVASQVHLYDSKIFQGEERSTRWIHFPANNRSWIEDLCRCMYSHGSLHSEGIRILRFIEDSFEEVEGSQDYRYRKHGFNSGILEQITDPLRKTTSRHEAAATNAECETHSGDSKHAKDVFSAYSLVFPLLDIDFIRPGFCYSQESGTGKSSSMSTQRSAVVIRPQRIHRMSPTRTGPELPTDADQRSAMQTHWKNMEALGQRKTVHLSRSLDHYCHQRASSEELQARVEDQVLSRFMKRQISGGDTSPTPEKTDFLKTLSRTCSDLARRLLSSSIPRSRDQVPSEASLEKGGKRETSTAKTAGETETLDDYLRATRDTETSSQILVVPQLWLWKFDNLVITSFPERWNCTYQRNSLTNVIREKVEYLNVDGEIEPNKLVTEILIACAEFQPTLSIGKQTFTWTDAFDDEVLSVSRSIKRCYTSFQNNLGESDEKFSKTFLAPTECLRSIDDVLDELTTIKRVFQDQLQVWEKVHSGNESCVICQEQSKSYNVTREGDIEGEEKDVGKKVKDTCPSNALPKRSLELAARLEEDALKVRESVVTLLTLLQGEASTENALKASEQSKILAVFTVVTVVFTPLSWVNSLFAIEVQSFPPVWTVKDLSLGSFYSIIITFAICALGLWILFYRSHSTRKGTGQKQEGPGRFAKQGPEKF